MASPATSSSRQWAPSACSSPLLQRCLQVTGSDTSEHMLRICRDNLAAADLTADVFIGDMVTYVKPGAFEAILVPTGSIVLLPDRDSRDLLGCMGAWPALVPAMHP